MLESELLFMFETVHVGKHDTNGWEGDDVFVVSNIGLQGKCWNVRSVQKSFY